MKRIQFLLLVISASWLQAQVTITSATFPKTGDTLRTVFADPLPNSLSVGNVGGPQTWDFSGLTTGQRNNQIFVPASGGKDAALFPDANLLVKNDGQELYLKSSSNKIEALGFSGENPFFDAPLVVKYSKKPVFRIAPLTFISTTNSSAEFRIDIGTSIIPDTLLANLPIKPDSIRIQFNNTDKGLMDAFGTMKLQGKTFSVLREKVESITETKLFIKLFGLWIDPLPLLGGNIPGGFGAFLGQDTTYVYNFYSDTKKEVLVSAQFSTANELNSLEFADVGGVVSSAADVAIAEKLEIRPNPATDFVTVQSDGMPDDWYLVTISGLNGVPAKAAIYQLVQGRIADIDIQQIPQGQYILTVRDKSNRRVVSDRLTIFR